MPPISVMSLYQTELNAEYRQVWLLFFFGIGCFILWNFKHYRIISAVQYTTNFKWNSGRTKIKQYNIYTLCIRFLTLKYVNRKQENGLGKHAIL